MIYPQREQRSRFIWSDILMRILPKQQKNGNKITFFKFLPQERRFHFFLFFFLSFFFFCQWFQIQISSSEMCIFVTLAQRVCDGFGLQTSQMWGVTSVCLFVDLFVFGHKLCVRVCVLVCTRACVPSWMDALGFSSRRRAVLERWIWSCSWRFTP